MWFEYCGFLMPSRQHTLLILSDVIAAQQDANPELNIAGGQVRRFNGNLYLTKQMENVSTWREVLQQDKPLLLPDGLGELTLTSPRVPSRQPLGEAGDLYSAMTLRGSYSGSLEVIFEPQGLSAHPSQRGHRRKLKKLFQEYQVPSWLRRRTPILINEGNVVAVLGLFVDKSYQGQDCEVVWNK
jgi:tRNA(Ile)-lysidine synthase